MLTIILLSLTAVAIETRVSLANTIPASTVGQSNGVEDTLGGWIRHDFWAVGRHWIFWSTSFTGGYLTYSTSTDGVNWSPPIQVLGPGINSDTYATIWFNGTHVMYSALLFYTGNIFVFRMGKPNPNGSITWVAPQQTISNNTPIYTDIKTDSNGYVWVSYTTISPMHTYVMQNQKRDGSWLNGTQFQLDQTSFSNYLPTDIVPLSNGKMYFVYNSNRCTPGGTYGRLWNGTMMTPQEKITDQCPSDLGYSSAVAVGDNVYLAYGGGGGSVHFMRRLGNGTWTPDFLIQTAGNMTIVSMSLNGTKNLVIFWQGGNPANTVFYRIYDITSNSWSPTVTWFIDSEGFTLEGGIYSRPGSFYNDFGNSSVRYIGFQYSAGNIAPYDVKYAFLVVSPKGNTLFSQIFPIVNVTN